jgi:hypothetical protein
MRDLLCFYSDFAFLIEKEVAKGLTYGETEELMNWTDFALSDSVNFGDISSLCF